MNVAPLSSEHADEIAGWHYAPPYDFYDFEADPADLAELLDPARRDHWRAVLDEDGTLVGFYWFAPRPHELEVGLGLRPDLTGRGLGRGFVENALEYARREWAPLRFRLYVAAFNERAQWLYERAGFRVVGTQTRTFERFGAVDFVEMERPA